MPRRRHRCQIVTPGRQNRAILCPAQGQRDRRRILDLDDRGAAFKGLVAIRGQVFFGVFRVQLLDKEILIVEVGRGQPPANLRAAPGQDCGHAGDRAANHTAGIEFQPGQVPDRRGGKPKVRIVGQQCPPRGRAAGRGGKGIGSPGQTRTGRGPEQSAIRGRGRITRQVGKERRIFRQRGHASARRIGENIRYPPRIFQHQGGAGAQHLMLQMPGQTQAHQLDNGQGICRLPRRDGCLEQEHLRGAASQRAFIDFGQPRVHPRRIGHQRRAGVIILCRNRRLRQPIEIKAPQQLVGFDGSGAKHLRQTPLRRPPHRRHLPQPVLRMGITEAKKHIRIGLRKNMRHVGIVPHDFHRRPKRAHRQPPVVIGQGLAGQIPHQKHRQRPQDEHSTRDPHEPAKDQRHFIVPVVLPCQPAGHDNPLDADSEAGT